MPEDMSEYMPEDMSDRMPEDMSEYMPEDMPDRMPDWMPDKMSDRVPEDMPDRMPEDLPDRMPEDMPEDMPDHMPEDMPDRMPNRMSEDMSDRMPEDLPVRKCINVMVGITRSKVIILKATTWIVRQIAADATPWYLPGGNPEHVPPWRQHGRPEHHAASGPPGWMISLFAYQEKMHMTLNEKQLWQPEYFLKSVQSMASRPTWNEAKQKSCSRSGEEVLANDAVAISVNRTAARWKLYMNMAQRTLLSQVPTSILEAECTTRLKAKLKPADASALPMKRLQRTEGNSSKTPRSLFNADKNFSAHSSSVNWAMEWNHGRLPTKHLWIMCMEPLSACTNDSLRFQQIAMWMTLRSWQRRDSRHHALCSAEPDCAICSPCWTARTPPRGACFPKMRHGEQWSWMIWNGFGT